MIKITTLAVYVHIAIFSLMAFSGCDREVSGCTDMQALNYDANATIDNGSCTYDPCLNVNCLNGDCVEGNCICDPGYYGSTCSQPNSDRFVGNFTVTETCDGVQAFYSCSIAGSIPNPEGIIFQNLGDLNGTTQATTDSIQIQIPRQPYGTDEISGSGTVDPGSNQITLNYTIITTGTTILCNAVLTKQ